MPKDQDKPAVIIIERSLIDAPEKFRPAEALVKTFHPPTGILMGQMSTSFIPLTSLPGRVVFKGDFTAADSPPNAVEAKEAAEVTIPLANIKPRDVQITEDNITVEMDPEDLADELKRGIPSPEILDLGNDLTGRAWRAKIIQYGFENPLAS